jgi:hypothetical protein
MQELHEIAVRAVFSRALSDTASQPLERHLSSKIPLSLDGHLVRGRWCLGIGRLIPMLTASELLAKVKELGKVSKSELVRECG